MVQLSTTATLVHSTPAEPPSQPVGSIWHFEDDKGWVGTWNRKGTKDTIGSFAAFSGLFNRGDEVIHGTLIIRITADGTVSISRFSEPDAVGASDCDYIGMITGPSLVLTDGHESYLEHTEVVGRYRCNDLREGDWTASFR